MTDPEDTEQAPTLDECILAVGELIEEISIDGMCGVY